MMGHLTSSTEAAGIFLNFSQACQNKMFSALTSDFKKACRETNGENTHTPWEININNSKVEHIADCKMVDTAGIFQQLLK